MRYDHLRHTFDRCALVQSWSGFNSPDLRLRSWWGRRLSCKWVWGQLVPLKRMIVCTSYVWSKAPFSTKAIGWPALVLHNAAVQKHCSNNAFCEGQPALTKHGPTLLARIIRTHYPRGHVDWAARGWASSCWSNAHGCGVSVPQGMKGNCRHTSKRANQVSRHLRYIYKRIWKSKQNRTEILPSVPSTWRVKKTYPGPQ